MPRSRHSHLRCFGQWQVRHKTADINLLHGLAIVVADVRRAVKDQVFEIALVIQGRNLINKVTI
jgi:hypothetical protein